MKFMCFAYEDEETLNALSAREWDELRGETTAYVESLKVHGRLVSTYALQAKRKATTVKVRDGQRLVTDGPFAEAKEHLGGYLLLDVDSLERATEIAAAWPQLESGAIELRPLLGDGGDAG